MSGPERLFTAAIPVAEFAALRSVGYEPLGQVMGMVVRRFGRVPTFCIVRKARSADASFLGFSGVAVQRNLGEQVGLPRLQAIERMRDEAAEMGSDGIVGVRLIVRPSVGGGREFIAVGTAVRAGPAAPSRMPQAPRRFDTDLSGPDVAKLIGGGFAPLQVALGVSVMLRHEDERMEVQMGTWVNNEIGGATALIQAARAGARADLVSTAARFPGSTVLVRDLTLDVREVPCRLTGTDHRADAVFCGTVIRPLPGGSRAPAPRTFTVMRVTGGTDG
jgi:hypothetical protein